jgi:hypothetical protein
MTPILRFQPGVDAPWTGRYALVGHFGEPTGFKVWLDQGQRLPLVTASAELGELSYVLTDAPSDECEVA